MLSSKAYTEAYYLISSLSEELRNKIPEKILKNIQNRMDKKYDFNIKFEDYENVKLLEDTEKILSVIYTDYLATEEEREIILNKEKIIAQRNQMNLREIEINEIFREKKNVAKKQEKNIHNCG